MVAAAAAGAAWRAVGGRGGAVEQEAVVGAAEQLVVPQRELVARQQLAAADGAAETLEVVDEGPGAHHQVAAAEAGRALGALHAEEPAKAAAVRWGTVSIPPRRLLGIMPCCRQFPCSSLLQPTQAAAEAAAKVQPRRGRLTPASLAAATKLAHPTAARFLPQFLLRPRRGWPAALLALKLVIRQQKPFVFTRKQAGRV